MGWFVVSTERINVEEIDRTASPIRGTDVMVGFEVGEEGQMAGRASVASEIKSLIGAIVTDIEITGNGNLRIIGQDVDGNAVDAVLPLSNTVTTERELHYSFDLDYNTTDGQFDGTLFYSDTDDVTEGNILIFRVPSDRPELATRTWIKLASEANRLALRDYFADLVYVRDLVPGRIYFAIRSALGLVLLNPVGEPQIVRTYSRTVTNAELKTLDTDYLELIAAPGAGKYIEVRTLWQTKNGDDAPATFNPYWFRLAFSDDTTLTAQEAAAGTLYTTQQYGNGYQFPVATGADKYAFIGVRATEPDPFFGTLRASNGGHILTTGASDVTAQSGTLMVDGVETKWWYINTRSYPVGDISEGYIALSPGTGPATADTINDRAWLMYLYPSAQGMDRITDDETPMFTFDGDIAYAPVQTRLNAVMALDDGVVSGNAFGDKSLLENAAFLLGVTISGRRASNSDRHSEAAYDAYLNPVNDVTLDITIQYQVHEI